MTRNRKIVIATTAIGSGGLRSYLVTLATGLKARGWDVHLLIANERESLCKEMKEAAVYHDLSGIPLTRKKVFRSAELINNLSPDILLMNNCALMHYALPLINPAVKPIAVLHSDDKRFYKTAALFEKRIFRWIAPTRGLAERFKTNLQGEQKERVRIIPHGIDNKLFNVKKKSKGSIGGEICFVGFIAENKGAELLPDIFGRVLKTYKNAHLTIVGYGPLEETLKRRFDTNETLQKYNFTGMVTHDKVAAILRDSDILLLPTRIEGFGICIVEAMMSGAVPVVSRIKGVTDEIVSDGITGLLVEPDDIEGFAEAIAGLLKNPEKLLSMSEATRKTAVIRYSSGSMIDAYEALFAEEEDRQKRKQSNNLEWLTELLPEITRNGSFRALLRKGRYLFH